jgi:glucose-1-phosphate adenylyltransferase
LPGSRLRSSRVHDAIIADGCSLDECTVIESVIGIRSQIQAGTTVRRSVLLGADYYDTDQARPANGMKLGIGKNTELDGVIVDKNARIGDNVRLVNVQRLKDFDGEGYYIRDGIIIVPKDGSIPSGTVV